MSAPLPDNEVARLTALRECKILNTFPEKAFDDITRLAAQICGTPVALVSLVDENRQWFKSKLGLEIAEIPRDISLCARAILQPHPLIIPDTLKDKRFATNPLVTAAPYIRFYAGAPLVTADGYALGTLCVIDYVPRELTPAQVEALQVLTRQVVWLLELHRNQDSLSGRMHQRQRSPQERQQFLRRIAAAFGLATAVLLGIGIASYQNSIALIKTADLKLQDHLALEELKNISFQTQQAALAKYRYVTTGESSNLETYYEVVEQNSQSIKNLRQAFVARPDLQYRLNNLEFLIAKNFAQIETTINLRKTKQLNPTLQLLHREGKKLTNDVQATLGELEKVENEALAQRLREEKVKIQNIISTFSAGVISIFLIFVGVYYFMRHAIATRQRIETVLKQERDFNSAVIDTSSALTVVLDAQGRVFSFNRACEQISGYLYAEVQGKYFWDLFLIPEETARVKTVFTQLQAGQFPNQYESNWLTRDGDRRLISWSNTALVDADGAVEYIVSIGIDLTERQQAEDRVNLLHQLMRAIGEAQDFDRALTSILQIVCEAEDWNYGEAWIPCSKANILTCSPAWYCHADDRDREAFALLQQFRSSSEKLTFALGTGMPGRVWRSQQPEWREDISTEPETAFLRSQIALDCQLKAAMGVPLIVKGQVLAVLGFFKFESARKDSRLLESISATTAQLSSLIQRKQIEQMLRESEARFQAFMNNSLAVQFIKDEQGRYVYVNQRFTSLFNVNLSDLQGKTDFDWLPEATAKQVRENDLGVLSTGQTMEVLETVPTPDGSPHIWLVFKFPIEDTRGRRLLGGVALDLTKQKQTEALLQETMALQQAILNNTNYIIISTAVDGTILSFNAAAEQQLGYAASEVVGKTTPAIFHDDREVALTAQELSRKLGTSIAPGFEVFVAKALYKEANECEWTYIRKDGSRFPVLLSITAMWDAEDKLTGFLGIANDITERKRTQETQQRQLAAIEAAMDGIAVLNQDSQYIYLNKAHIELFGYSCVEQLGGKTWKELYYPDEISRLERDIFPILQQQKHWQGEATAKKKDGSTFAEEVSLTLIENVGLICVCRDITERKQAEEKIQESLQEKEVLLKEIHHRVKNNLQIISGLFYLQSRYTKDEQILQLLQENQARIQSMALIHEKLYGSENLKEIDFKDYISSLVRTLFVSYNINTKAIALKISCEQVYLDIDLAIPCGLIINELVSNSLKHAFLSSSSGEIAVEFYKINQNIFELVIRDNGIGIPKKIDFEKPQSLGLRLINSLVKRQLEGTIQLDRSEGTKFTICWNL